MLVNIYLYFSICELISFNFRLDLKLKLQKPRKSVICQLKQQHPFKTILTTDNVNINYTILYVFFVKGSFEKGSFEKGSFVKGSFFATTGVLLIY